MDSFFYYESESGTSARRDLLDIMESYKYLNSYLMNEPDSRWDYARGWLELNMNSEEWRMRPDFNS